MFNFTHQFVQPGSAADGDGVPECRRCFGKWIVDACAEADASQGLRGLPPSAPAESNEVNNLASFLDRAQIPARHRSNILKDIVDFGAVDVAELGQEDWESLSSWGNLKVAERRRILAAVSSTSA